MGKTTFDTPERHGRLPPPHQPQWLALARKFMLGLSLVLACQSALAQAMYRIRPLGYLGGCTSSPPYIGALNATGQATGQACNANGDFHAFLWKNDGTPIVDLGPNKVGSTSNGSAISPSGLVAGSATDSTGSFVFVSSGNGSPVKKIFNSLGGSSIGATAVNDHGQWTGYATTGGSFDEEHALVWKNDGSPLLDLGIDAYDYSYGNAINASGTVAATAGSASERFNQGFVLKNDGSPVTWLIAATADFINKFGQVTGIDSDAWRHNAFLWSNDGTQIDLGTLGGNASWPPS